MHVIIGLLGSIVSLLWILHRLAEMGIDLGGLNPWYWWRRRKWQQKYEGDPINAVEDPMEIGALVVVAMAKVAGDITAEQKNIILNEFIDTFSLDSKSATQLFGSCTHLLGQPQVIDTQLAGLFDRHNDLFSAEQAESVVGMMRKVAEAEGAPNEQQRQLMGDVREKLGMPPAGEGIWA